MAWQPIGQQDTGSIQAALALLQATMDGYAQMTVPILQGKMQPGKNPPTQYFCLLLYSYGNPLNPLVSAFFFLRRRKKNGNPDAPADWAYCLTVGAKDTVDGGLSSDDLRDALNDVCLTVRALAPAMELEVMYLPPSPVFKIQNLKDVFAELHLNAKPPKKKPRFNDKGTITLGYPWVPLDANGNEVFMQFVWLQIVLKT